MRGVVLVLWRCLVGRLLRPSAAAGSGGRRAAQFLEKQATTKQMWGDSPCQPFFSTAFLAVDFLRWSKLQSDDYQVFGRIIADR